jgi:hypothetical protein
MQTCSNHANFAYLRYRRQLVSLLHQTYRRRGNFTTGSLSKFFTLLYTFLSTLLLILYPSQPASDDSGNDFINNLFNSSEGG